MDNFNSTEVKNKIDKINIPEEKLNTVIQIAVKNGKSKTRNWPKKFLIFSSAAMILFALFIGSAFVSPAMAKVVKKIPYLGELVKPKVNIMEEITEALRNKKLNAVANGVNYYPEKEIYISIEGSEAYYHSVKKEVEKIVEDILFARGYDAYKVKISKFNEKNSKIEEYKIIKQEMENLNKEGEIYSSLEKEFRARNFKVNLMSIGHNPNVFSLEIPKTETRVEELKKIIQTIFKEQGIADVTIKIKKFDLVKKEQEMRWSDILSSIEEDLIGKSEYKVEQLGYSVHPEPQLLIYTTLPDTGKSSKAFAEQLEKVINDFLQSDDMKRKVKNEKYEIKIYNNKYKRIN
ncbi:DUF4030 domain-containing protein [Niallia sp. NCCP-28]|uniref:DUF4030 domain-containing protein n=1 Tax=Niallia sp. NCCP-28 TaxID=2934712 RepID=UPI00207E6369|nr:DUF4030 domain-containing protein [Niallia sp. NCCP-28]GKU82119.1 hypothetical protein NCCP28_15150 [Niallia sp. NCCP-28]